MTLFLKRNIIRCFTTISYQNFLRSFFSSSRRSGVNRNFNVSQNLQISWPYSQDKDRPYSQDKDKSVTIVFEKLDGTRKEIKGKIGKTVQEAVGAYNPEFQQFGECDGFQICSTCHVILKGEDYDKLRTPEVTEQETLDYTVDRTETSRLACAIEVIPEMDGMVLKLPTHVKDIRVS